MARVLLMVAAFLAAAGLIAILTAPATHSQQLGAGSYSWGFAPRGVLADARIQQGIANLVDNSKVMAEAGVAGDLSYSTDLPHQPRGSIVEDSRMLFAAAGFSEPGGQLYQGRQCRFRVPRGGSQELIAVGYSLGRELALGLAQISVKIEACGPTPDSASADVFVVPSGTPAPFDRNTDLIKESSFRLPTDQHHQPYPPSSGRQLTAPTTGDAGLLP